MSAEDLEEAMGLGAPLSIEILGVRHGHALAWSAPWGAAASIVSRYAPESARPAIALGTSDRTRTEAPRLFRVTDGIAAMWCQDDGAWLAVIRDDGEGLAREPERVLAGGRSLCVAAGRRTSHVFVEDGECVRMIAVDADARWEIASEPLLVQRGRVRMAAARASDAPLLIATYADDRRLIIADGARGHSSLVRHGLPAECRALDAYAVGGRAAFALALDGGELVQVGVVDAAGMLVERPHVLLREPGALYTHVRVVWMERDFHVVARDGRHDRVSVVAIDSGREALSVPRVKGAFAVAYHAERFVLAQAFADGDVSVLRIARCSLDGRERAVFDVREPPPASLRARRAEEQVARCMDELERMLGAAGYRDARAVRVDLDRGAALRLAEEALQLELRPGGDELRVSVVALRAEDGVTRRNGSLERLARWVRERLSPEARRNAARDRAVGERLAEAIEGVLELTEQNESGWRCEVRVAQLPAAQRLRVWLLRAQELIALRDEGDQSSRGDRVAD